MLRDRDMSSEAASFIVINILPAQTQKIADAKRCLDVQREQYIVSDLSALQKVVRHCVEVLLASDRFGCCHNISSPFASSIRRAEGPM